ASDSVEQTRTGIEEQGRAMLAMVDQGRAAFEQAGAEASRRLSERLDQVGTHLEELSGQLAAQEAASQALVTGLAARLAEIDAQIAAIGEHGDVHNARLANAMEGLKSLAQSLRNELAQGEAASGGLIDRTHEVAASLADITSRMREELPAAL